MTNWIKEIEESENINQLPLFEELNEIAENEERDLYDEWDGKEITIEDGTVIELEYSGHYCFSGRRNEWIFYHVKDTEIFICAECGLIQKACRKVKEEVEEENKRLRENLKDVIKEVRNKNEKIEYQYQSYLASQKNLQMREKAWESKECEDLYEKLINVAGGFRVVRPGMRGRAKQMAITCYMKGQEPNYEKFKNDVKIANKIHAKHTYKNNL